MNGASDEPLLITIIKPRIPKKMTIGNKKYFFLFIKNNINSKKFFISQV